MSQRGKGTRIHTKTATALFAKQVKHTIKARDGIRHIIPLWILYGGSRSLIVVTLDFKPLCEHLLSTEQRA